MMTTAKKRAATLGAMLVVGAASGWAVRSAWADGIPDADVLTYAGTLEDNAGVPLSGSKSIQVNVYPDATTGAKACSSPDAIQNVVAGRFEVKMPASCVTAMKGNPNAHVEVIVDGKSLGKSRVGAVPYAIEAARAGEATGALRAQVDAKADQTATTAALATKAEKSTVPVVQSWTKWPASVLGGSSAIQGEGYYRTVGDTVECRVTVTPSSPWKENQIVFQIPPGLQTDFDKIRVDGLAGIIVIAGVSHGCRAGGAANNCYVDLPAINVGTSPVQADFRLPVKKP